MGLIDPRNSEPLELPEPCRQEVLNVIHGKPIRLRISRRIRTPEHLLDGRDVDCDTRERANNGHIDRQTFSPGLYELTRGQLHRYALQEGLDYEVIGEVNN